MSMYFIGWSLDILIMWLHITFENNSKFCISTKLMFVSFWIQKQIQLPSIDIDTG